MKNLFIILEFEGHLNRFDKRPAAVLMIQNISTVSLAGENKIVNALRGIFLTTFSVFLSEMCPVEWHSARCAIRGP